MRSTLKANAGDSAVTLGDAHLQSATAAYSRARTDWVLVGQPVVALIHKPQLVARIVLRGSLGFDDGESNGARGFLVGNIGTWVCAGRARTGNGRDFVGRRLRRDTSA